MWTKLISIPCENWQNDGSLSQRDLSRKIGLSLGTVNFVVNALLKREYIKARRFENPRKKIAYR